MTNSKNTKRALLSSALALLVCVAMLIGTTFAWFTDTASTAVNKIQAGTLDIALEMKDGDEWVSAEGKTLNFKAADGRTNILWEPGCTYELPELRIVNKGNLALKYKIVVNGVDGNAKLLEAIEWTIEYPAQDDAAITRAVAATGNSESYLLPGATADGFIIKGHMMEEAGNEYQGLSIEGVGITVYATQYTYESDSYDNQYDADAEYDVTSVWDGTVDTSFTMDEDGVYHITTAAQLAGLAASVNSGNTYENKTIKLDNNIDLANRKWIPIGLCARAIEGNSTLLHISFKGTFDGQNHTISNMKTSDKYATDTLKLVGAPALFGATDAGAQIKNLTVKNALVWSNAQYGYASAIVGSHSSGSLEISGVSVEDSTICAGRSCGGFVGIANRAAADSPNVGNVTLSNCSMNNVDFIYVHSFGNDSTVIGVASNGVVNGMDGVPQTDVTVTEDTADGRPLYYSYQTIIEQD